MRVGIEAINAYTGPACIDVRALFRARGLDLERFDNLLMERKSIALPCEDAVTYAVNAAKPLIDGLPAEERQRVELVITATESGLDFGKSLATYVHAQLGLGRRCRLFEVKQACYAGTAALQMAAAWVASGASPGAKALVIATDTSRSAAKHTYAEPSQGVAAVALLVSEHPDVLELDFGANGYHGYEVMDTCRPAPDVETGDPDLSLLSYLDCLEQSYAAYCERVEGVDLRTTFDYLAFHTPFAGMVRGAHRQLMRRSAQATPQAIAADFEARVGPSLRHCVQVGNVYSATLYLALCGVIEYGHFDGPRRIGLFSYGSGCSSEFYSGVVPPGASAKLAPLALGQRIAQRVELDIPEYDRILDLNAAWTFGRKDGEVDLAPFAALYERQFAGQGKLVLRAIKDYHREYGWS
jgi:polyketide biosynthesis 3-hydroxy-3-methylglutaryl-CoA synthase-like enzyme PksG